MSDQLEPREVAEMLCLYVHNDKAMNDDCRAIYTACEGFIPEPASRQSFRIRALCLKAYRYAARVHDKGTLPPFHLVYQCMVLDDLFALCDGPKLSARPDPAT